VPEEDATFAADDDVPFGLLAETTTTAPPAPAEEARRIRVCFVRGVQVVPVEREPDGPGLQGALATLAAGPTSADEASGLRTALLAEDAVGDVTLTAGVARVGLRQSFAIGTEDSILALAQLVCTLTAQPGVGQVAFTLEGQAVEVPLADGSLAARPVTRDDYASVIAPA
jgi:spore germination protein GerM